MGKLPGRRAAVFIDRDGTLIRERHYLRRIKDMRLISGAVEALQRLRKAGFRVIVVTNQSGIGRGYLTEKKLGAIHRHLDALLRKKGARVDAFYYCPHHPDADCECRKPRLGMVLKAKERFGLDLKRSFAVGDHVNDFKLGQNMGGKGIFVLTGHGRREREKIRASNGRLEPDAAVKDIAAAAGWILRQQAAN